MTNKQRKGHGRYAWLMLVVLVVGCSSSLPTFVPEDVQLPENQTLRAAYLSAFAFLDACKSDACGIQISSGTTLDTIFVDANETLVFSFNRDFANTPFRTENTARIYEDFRSFLGKRIAHLAVEIRTLGQPIETLVPNYYRTDLDAYDRARMPNSPRPTIAPLVQRIDAPWTPDQGLQGRHIAVWSSHGWYFEHRLNRWEWQRARVFETVEDLLPMAFIVPYLAPMLERAGAYVLMPRERDIQVHEVVVDNDTEVSPNEYVESQATDGPQWQTGDRMGFALGKPPYLANENPFGQGTYRYLMATPEPTADVSWTPNMPGAGRYAVYVSWQSIPGSVSDAKYTVHHLGGTTTFQVNQQIGGGTWVYLGTFAFDAGLNPSSGRVVLTNASEQANGIITADAVKFGGGMGNVAREGQVSGRPRFAEAARYYMQYAGFPDSLVYNVSDPDEDDYVDDYRSRGEWVNYLRGAPFGPNKNRNAKGLGIPVDLSFAFHTDAGFTRNDTTVGTLMIYNSTGADGTTDFPDGMARWANRDFADLMQTQIVDDIRALYDPAWNRRPIWDRGYSEAQRPNVPGVLLELLSHHNFLDMKFALDPRFRFDVSRSIYKSMLRFLAVQDGDFGAAQAVVQPLPVTHMAATFSGERTVELTWQPQTDPLEPSAASSHYIVYTREEGGDFDDGELVDEPRFSQQQLAPGVLYSYRVEAVNAGGRSMPSEVLSVSWVNGQTPVLVVNGFDRIAPPATIESGEWLGFASFEDQGVPDGIAFHKVGRQYDFMVVSPWLDDDAPGHGASYADTETQLIMGNTFDFVAIHGDAIRAAGHSFVSISDEVLEERPNIANEYGVLNLVLGEERTTQSQRPNYRPEAFEAFPKAMQEALRSYVTGGGHLLVSGAYVGTDLYEGTEEEDPNRIFAAEVLGIRHRTNHAARLGRVVAVSPMVLGDSTAFHYNTAPNDSLYVVEAPDGIEPADDQGMTILRYAENNISAGVAHVGRSRKVVLGFPIEAMGDRMERHALMRALLDFLDGSASLQNP